MNSNVNSGTQSLHNFIRKTHERHIVDLAIEILQPHQPKLTTEEAICLLDCFNSTAEPPILLLADVPAFLANTLFSLFLEQRWGDGTLTLQETLDRYETVEWGPEITDDPRIKFVDRLRKMAPIQAAALFVLIREWWANRHSLGDDVHTCRPETLRLKDFFDIEE